MLSQLELLRDLHRTLAGPDSAKGILEIMEIRKDHRKILSSTVHMIYVNALLHQRVYDKLFIVVSRLVIAHVFV